MLVKGPNQIINLNNNNLCAKSYGGDSVIKIVKGVNNSWNLAYFNDGKAAHEILADIWRAFKAGAGYYEIPTDKLTQTGLLLKNE